MTPAMREHRLHARARKDAQSARYWLDVDKRRRLLAERAVRHVVEMLRDLGIQAQEQGHNDNFDLLTDSGLRVEVKAATWRGGRFQANLRSNLADVVVLACRISQRRWGCFVIPFGSIRSRNIAVWSRDPARYAGQWRPHLEDWSLIQRS